MFQRYFAYLRKPDQLIWSGGTFYVGGRTAAIKGETLDIGIVVQRVEKCSAGLNQYFMYMY